MTTNPIKKVAVEISDIRREIEGLRSPQLNFSSWENGGSNVYDEDGTVGSTVGKQDDGGFGVGVFNSPIPHIPSAPILEGGSGTFSITWDGFYQDPEARRETYFDFNQALVSRSPDMSNWIHGGSLLAADTITFTTFDEGMFYVAFVVESKAGRRSPMSVIVAVEVDPTVTQAKLDNARQILEDADQEIKDAAALRDQKLSDADDAITAAEGRLDTAEDDLVTAFGAINTDIPADIETAKQAAITDAATTAQEKADAAQDAAEAYTENQVNLVNNPSATGTDDRWGMSNGTTEIVFDDFFGTSIPVIKASSDGDGMVVSDQFSVDASKTYEIRLWVRDPSIAGGTGSQFYFGVYTNKSSGARSEASKILVSTGDVSTASTNNYFSHTGEAMADYIEYVAYLLPYGINPEDAIGLGKNVDFNVMLSADTVYGEVRFLNWDNEGTFRDVYGAHITVTETSFEAIKLAHDAQVRADDAHTLAGTAEDNAQLAITSANGKNSVHRDTTAPVGDGTTEGDVWWRFKDNTWKEVVGEWSWDGDSWEKQQLSHEMFSSVDIATLSVIGQSTLADVVAENMSVTIGKFIELDVEQLTVTGTGTFSEAVMDEAFAEMFSTRKLYAESVVIGEGSNILSNPDFLDNGKGWQDAGTFDTSGGMGGTGSVLIPSGTSTRGNYFALTPVEMRPRVVPGDNYRLSAWVRTSETCAAGAIRLYVRFYQAGDPSTWELLTFVNNSEVIPANTWTKVEGILEVPDNAATVVYGLYVTSVYTGAVRFSQPSMVLASGGELIVQESIFTKHLTATEDIVGQIVRGTSFIGKDFTGATFTTTNGGKFQTHTATNQGVKMFDNELAGWDYGQDLFFRMHPSTGLWMKGIFETELGSGTNLRIGADIGEDPGTLGAVPGIAWMVDGRPYGDSPRIFSYENGDGLDLRGGGPGVSSYLQLSNDFLTLSANSTSRIEMIYEWIDLRSWEVQFNAETIWEDNPNDGATFYNGWSNFSTSYNSFSARKTAPGVVSIGGLLGPGSSVWNDMHVCTISDPDLHPARKQYIPAIVNDNGIANYYAAVITVDVGGAVRVRCGDLTSSGYLSIGTWYQL